MLIGVGFGEKGGGSPGVGRQGGGVSKCGRMDGEMGAGPTRRWGGIGIVPSPGQDPAFLFLLGLPCY